MKFARYLKETQTAEWKKAYIDYRGLKKRITAIRRWQEGHTSILTPPGSEALITESPRTSEESDERTHQGHDIEVSSSPKVDNSSARNQIQEPSTKSQKLSSKQGRFGSRLRRGARSLRANSTLHPYSIPPTLQELRGQLSPEELSFLDALDRELEKIETFYLDREKEMQTRTTALEEQLHELTYHRKLFHETHPSTPKPWVLGKVGKVGIKKPQKSVVTDGFRSRRNSNETTRPHGKGPSYAHALDPDEYQNAKKKLNKAVLEHYRGLETLHNYRVLNLTGFRKALKKFEKVTKIPLQNAYMTEKVEMSPLVSDKSVRNMMEEMENIYATQFARGDKKRAMTKLRGGFLSKSHHFSTFRSVIFSLLVGLNILVWARARINYVFIFELDYRTQLDHREYFEPSRYWLVRNVGRLLIPGVHRVEFTDFWMGDQFCSLIFTLSNVYPFFCSYAKGFDQWRQCGAGSKHWPIIFVLAMLPLLSRLIQSVRRYADSHLITHLINGGKYGSGIISYLFYFLWRHQGGNHGAIFALWCLCNTIYSLYASSWDFLMDWSVLKAHAKHPLLRNDLLYSNYVPSYYFAIISNVIIRFIWVIYIPQGGPDFYLRSFIAGMLESMRRVQWNFYRLENEHLGNMDQYRVTREVPLPYSLDDMGRDIDDDDVDDSH
ncbi:EXS family-domain-containing protein [Armillaria novae-zelandiae]|uniref:EXS family-domain-containing protein n=1 Tax=Armillaria novae-zelandiae TaxID=153914 RepID=A0AA39NYG4_9AGAR|nr:EXS family-domain-containing protein [Armillaria novae-zelandiae]